MDGLQVKIGQTGKCRFAEERKSGWGRVLYFASFSYTSLCMRAVVQRVTHSRVSVDNEICGAIGPGLLVLLGVGKDDTSSDVVWMAEKIAGLRIFSDEAGKMNLSVQDLGYSILLISQFTLFGDCRSGKRPGFEQAARPELAELLYQEVSQALQAKGLPVEHGRFRTHMQVDLCNDGPVTLLLDSKKLF